MLIQISVTFWFIDDLKQSATSTDDCSNEHRQKTSRDRDMYPTASFATITIDDEDRVVECSDINVEDSGHGGSSDLNIHSSFNNV